MFYFLYEYLYAPHTIFSFLRLFRYLTFRIIYAMVTAFLISLILGKPVIRWLKEKNIKDTTRELALVNASNKDGTPTMGGILIVISTLIPAILWCNLTNRFVQIIIFTTIWFAVLGYYDDLLKIK